MPAVFVGHGSPMNAIGDNEFFDGWKQLGESLPKPRAVLCVSAHWETRGTWLTGAEAPTTIHDFSGFPRELFEIRYPAEGDPDLAIELAKTLSDHNVRVDHERGLDHGAWSVLLAMYPEADIPVLQLSLDIQKTADAQYELAKGLADLRDEGVLLLGSGDIVHNLRLFRFDDPTPMKWALEFDDLVKEMIVQGDDGRLVEFEGLGPKAAYAIPTPEHYLPLLYVLALRTAEDEVSFFNEKVVGSLSMTSVVFG